MLDSRDAPDALSSLKAHALAVLDKLAMQHLRPSVFGVLALAVTLLEVATWSWYAMDHSGWTSERCTRAAKLNPSMTGNQNLAPKPVCELRRQDHVIPISARLSLLAMYGREKARH